MGARARRFATSYASLHDAFRLASQRATWCKSKKQKEKRDEFKGTRIGHVTERKRRQNLANCRSVYFQSWMKLLQSERSDTSFREKSYCLWNVVRLIFLEKHCCNQRSKRIEAVRFHHISCRGWTEQVCNPFVPSYECLIELKTEFELEQVNSMQLRNKITVVRNIRIQHLSLLNAKHKTQLFSV